MKAIPDEHILKNPRVALKQVQKRLEIVNRRLETAHQALARIQADVDQAVRAINIIVWEELVRPRQQK